MKEILCRYCKSPRLRANGGGTGRQVFCKDCGKFFTLALGQRLVRIKKSAAAYREYEVWDFPNAASEARWCLEVAQRNGGIPKMRELIRIDATALGQLESFATAFPKFRSRIERAIAFRADVLKSFDELTGAKGEQGFTREELASVANLLPVEQYEKLMSKAAQ